MTTTGYRGQTDAPPGEDRKCQLQTSVPKPQTGLDTDTDEVSRNVTSARSQCRLNRVSLSRVRENLLLDLYPTLCPSKRHNITRLLLAEPDYREREVPQPQPADQPPRQPRRGPWTAVDGTSSAFFIVATKTRLFMTDRNIRVVDLIQPFWRAPVVQPPPAFYETRRVSGSYVSPPAWISSAGIWLLPGNSITISTSKGLGTRY
jgi:hypothetical protein